MCRNLTNHKDFMTDTLCFCLARHLQKLLELSGHQQRVTPLQRHYRVSQTYPCNTFIAHKPHGPGHICS